MDLKIFQIFYKQEQVRHLDPAFDAYDNHNAQPPDNYEGDVFFKAQQKGLISTDLSGFMSWKFGKKTGISGQHLVQFIRDNPGFDVYLINPFPSSAQFHSVWSHGETKHPQITEIAQRLFDSCGYQIALAKLSTPMSILSYCNYWVGTRDFWESYLSYTKPIYKLLKEHERKGSLRMDVKWKAPYTPFIFERLISTYLAVHPEIKVCFYQYSSAHLWARYPKIAWLLIPLQWSAKHKNWTLYEMLRKMLSLLFFISERLKGLLARRRKRDNEATKQIAT